MKKEGNKTGLLTPEQVAEMLQIKLSTLYSWTHQRKIPHLKVGRLVRFSQSDLEKWLQTKHRVPQEADFYI